MSLPAFLDLYARLFAIVVIAVVAFMAGVGIDWLTYRSMLWLWHRLGEQLPPPRKGLLLRLYERIQA